MAVSETGISVGSDSNTAQQAADADNADENKGSLTTGPGNLDLVLQIIAQMCDGQNRNLQVCYLCGRD
jgi:hypothetical protein